jgi:hypothetical protein
MQTVLVVLGSQQFYGNHELGTLDAVVRCQQSPGYSEGPV